MKTPTLISKANTKDLRVKEKSIKASLSNDNLNDVPVGAIFYFPFERGKYRCKEYKGTGVDRFSVACKKCCFKNKERHCYSMKCYCKRADEKNVYFIEEK